MRRVFDGSVIRRCCRLRTNFTTAAIHSQESHYEMRDRDFLRYCINRHNVRGCTGWNRAGTSEASEVDNRDWATADTDT